MAGFPARERLHRSTTREGFLKTCERDQPNASNERHKAHSMSGFREPGFTDRQKAAQQAKQNLLNKFKAQPGQDDPEVAKRRAEREAIAANREKARLAREAERAEAKRREQEAAAAEAARIAREKEEDEARLAALEAEQKAKRDARYAARKERGKKKR
jgi:Family of unknown function (DUF6481)